MKFFIVASIDTPCFNAQSVEEEGFEGEVRPCSDGNCIAYGDSFYWERHALSEIAKVRDDLTEDIDGHLGGEGEYSYLAKENNHKTDEELHADPWWAHHRGQWCGWIDEGDFKTLLDEGGWILEDVETMGSFSGEMGWQPAVPCNLDSQDSIGTMYVTPIPEVGDPIYPKAFAARLVAEVLHDHGDDPETWPPGVDGGWSVVREYVFNTFDWRNAA